MFMAMIRSAATNFVRSYLPKVKFRTIEGLSQNGEWQYKITRLSLRKLKIPKEKVTSSFEGKTLSVRIRGVECDVRNLGWEFRQCRFPYVTAEGTADAKIKGLSFTVSLRLTTDGSPTTANAATTTTTNKNNKKGNKSDCIAGIGELSMSQNPKILQQEEKEVEDAIVLQQGNHLQGQRERQPRSNLPDDLKRRQRRTTTTTSSSSTNPIDDDPSTIRGTADHGARPGSLSPPAAKAEKTAGDESSSSSSSSSMITSTAASAAAAVKKWVKFGSSKSPLLAALLTSPQPSSPPLFDLLHKKLDIETLEMDITTGGSWTSWVANSVAWMFADIIKNYIVYQINYALDLQIEGLVNTVNRYASSYEPLLRTIFSTSTTPFPAAYSPTSSSSSSSSSTPTTPVQASAPPATAAAANEHAASTATTRNSRMKALEGKYYNYSKELMKGKRAAAAAPRTTVTRAVATGITRKSRDEPSSTTPPSPQNCGAATSFQIKAAFKISEAEATSRVDKVEATDSNPLFLSRSPPQTTQNKQSKHPTSKKRIIKGHRRDAFSNMLAEAANQGQAAGKDHFLQRLKSCN